MATTPINVSAAGGSPQRNRELLDNAIALANSSGDLRPIVIPAIPGGFTVDRPVFCFGPNLDIRGANPGTILRGAGAFPPVILGIDPEPSIQDKTLPPGPRKWSPDHWVDGRGKVDEKLAPESGKWWGLRSFNKDGPDTVYAFPHSPFTHPLGKSYGDLPGFAFDVAYDPHDTPLGKQVGGLEEAGWPKPWYLYTHDGGGPPVHVVTFATQSATDTRGTWREIRFPIPEKEGLRRVGFSIDLTTAAVSATVGGQRVPVDLGKIGPDWKPGLKFVDADLCAFKLGGLGYDAAAWQDNFGGPVKYTFYGARLGRLGESHSNDLQRFGDSGHSTLIGRLDLSKPIPDARLVAWKSGPSTGHVGGFGLALLGGNHSNAMNAGTRVRLTDLTLQSAGPETYPFGVGIWCGGSIGGGFRFERCSFKGGQDGFGGLIWGVAYPVLFRDCTFRGMAGNGFTAHQMSAKFEGQTIVEYPARNGMVFIRGNADLDGLFMSECGPGCLTNLSMLKGGRLTVRDFMFDTEYQPAPTLAVVLAERNVWGEVPGTYLSLSNGVIDGGAKGVPLVLLRDTSAEKGFPAAFDLRGVQSWHAERGPTVATDGPMWTGSVVDFLGNRKATREHVEKWGKTGVIEGAGLVPAGAD